MHPSVLISVLIVSATLAKLTYAQRVEQGGSISNIMQQLMEEANQIQPPAGTDSNRSPFWAFFRNIVQFMLNMLGQFLRLFTGFSSLGGIGRQELLVAKFKDNEKSVAQPFNNVLETEKDLHRRHVTSQDQQIIDEITLRLDKARDEIEQSLGL